MKAICLTTYFIILNVVITNGQQIKLNVVTFDPCKTLYEKELLIEVTNGDKVFQAADTTGTIYLPHPGTYKLKVLLKDYVTLVNSEVPIIITNGQNYDTLTRTRIGLCLQGNHQPTCGYFCCDKLCEGYNVDYFSNGKKMMEGEFMNGYPIGQLIFYNPDGTKKEIHYYDKLGKGNLEKKEIFK
jgi:hypothetical protein